MATKWPIASPSPSPRNPSARKPFYRLGAFYGGLCLGLLLFPFIFFALAVLTSHHANQAAKPATSGNITITMDDALLTTGMRLALKRALTQLPALPFAVTNVAAKTHSGDTVDLTADLGPINALIAISPQVSADGKLDFQITHTDIGGLFSLDAFNSAFEAALNDQFSDVGSGNLVKGLDYQLVGVTTTEGTLVLTAKLFTPGAA